MNRQLITKNHILSIMAALLLGACSGDKTASGSQAGAAVADNKKIAITAIVEHPSLDAVRKGILDELKNQGYEEGKNLTVDFQSAQGSTANAAQIAKKFAGSNPDVIVAISTPSAQSVAAVTKTIPVVYAAVTDPVAAKLVPSMEASGTNITGISDELPLEPQIDLMKKLVPAVKNIGYVYSPGEVNSTVVLEQLRAKLMPEKINIVAVPAQRSSDVLTAARSLSGKVDVIYTSLDNNVVSSYESMYKAAVEMKKPLVASDTESVSRGAVAALGVNYYDLGKKAGDMVVQILKGERTAGEIPSVRVSTLDLHLSQKNAAVQGVVLPKALLEQAKKVHE